MVFGGEKRGGGVVISSSPSQTALGSLNTKYFILRRKRREWLPNLPSQRLMFKGSTNLRSNWNLEMLVFEEGGKPEYPEKNPRSKDEN